MTQIIRTKNDSRYASDPLRGFWNEDNAAPGECVSRPDLVAERNAEIDDFDRAAFERGRREAYFSPETGLIETDNGVALSPSVARRLYAECAFSDYNLAFAWLVTYNFDVAACLAFYAQGGDI